jgi:ferritin-like metal-binding protein YciE
MTITTLKEKFVHDLGDIYDAEHRFLEAQQEMQAQAGAKTLKAMIMAHIGQTEQHLRNLEQVYGIVGEKPKRVKCDAATGLVLEGQKGLKEVAQGSAIGDCVITGAAAKVEQYEIASYRGLIMLSEQLAYVPVVTLLNQNLQQELETATKLEQSLPSLLAETMSKATNSN